jgi:hypothetical protein
MKNYYADRIKILQAQLKSLESKNHESQLAEQLLQKRIPVLESLQKQRAEELQRLKDQYHKDHIALSEVLIGRQVLQLK